MLGRVLVNMIIIPAVILTLSNGIIISFRSKVTTAIQGGEYGDLIGFSITLAPIGEPTKTIPTSL